MLTMSTILKYLSWYKLIQTNIVLSFYLDFKSSKEDSLKILLRGQDASRGYQSVFILEVFIYNNGALLVGALKIVKKKKN